MDTLTNLRTFMAVARHGGFSVAAKNLDVVPSVVAKRISQLEQENGTRLFERTTRRVAITDAGAQLRNRTGSLLGPTWSAVRSPTIKRRSISSTQNGNGDLCLLGRRDRRDQ